MQPERTAMGGMAKEDGRRPKQRTVWLTFDDGPDPRSTVAILKTLDRFGIKATFFVVGQNVSRHGSIVRETAAAGHRIGNHTYTHPRLTTLTTADVTREIRSTEDLLGNLVGMQKLFRPPFGDRDRRINRMIRRCGYRSVLWHVSTRDWDAASQPTGWMDLGIAGVRRRERSVVLMHDIQATTAAYLPTFVERLLDIDGLQFGAPGAI